jgi:hypothetical protein
MLFGDCLIVLRDGENFLFGTIQAGRAPKIGLLVIPPSQIL